MVQTSSFPLLRQFFACVATPKRPRRALILVHGPDTVPFLQGLCTAHVSRLAARHLPLCSSACFLDRRGRVLFDTLLWFHNNERVYLDLDERVVQLALRHLGLHRLRARVHWERVSASLFIQASVDTTVIEPVKPSSESTVQVRESGSYAEMQATDPRQLVLGKRIWVLAGSGLGQGVLATAQQASRPARCYHSFWLAELHRVLHAIPQGIQDVAPGQALPLECNFEQLGAIAFDKGCYLGQELTARTHYTGVVRKRTVAGVLSPDPTEAMERAEAAAEFVHAVQKGTENRTTTLFPREALTWPVPAPLQRQLLHARQERIMIEPVHRASTEGRTRASLGTVVANLATALVPLADTDLNATPSPTARLFRITDQTPSMIEKWFFAWWVPPYLQMVGRASVAPSVS
ncbi:Iron-sulfur clusters incorporation protein [Cyanidiococcus yangmingshanensis]|uniref:Iron-sulfur clusters incorporation protein n=1 Tax=Cyanidiococcus yangmingshanensis TaxID=2690220 RepID=A0A7J7IH86_9RHOD|nr:Iron-sulfur clusters incorporation protein [Cyanidiococcus yangmingshanensis]